MSSRHEAQVLRKRMLIMRAAVERVELKEHVAELKTALSLPAVLRSVLPALTAKRGLPFLINAFRRYPILSSGLSYIGARLKIPAISSAIRWAGLGVLIWQGYVWVRRYQRDASPGPRARARAAARNR